MIDGWRILLGGVARFGVDLYRLAYGRLHMVGLCGFLCSLGEVVECLLLYCLDGHWWECSRWQMQVNYANLSVEVGSSAKQCREYKATRWDQPRLSSSGSLWFILSQSHDSSWIQQIRIKIYPPWNQHGTWRIMFARLMSIWEDLFSGVC